MPALAPGLRSVPACTICASAKELPVERHLHREVRVIRACARGYGCRPQDQRSIRFFLRCVTIESLLADPGQASAPTFVYGYLVRHDAIMPHLASWHNPLRITGPPALAAHSLEFTDAFPFPADDAHVTDLGSAHQVPLGVFSLRFFLSRRSHAVCIPDLCLTWLTGLWHTGQFSPAISTPDPGCRSTDPTDLARSGAR